MAGRPEGVASEPGAGSAAATGAGLGGDQKSLRDVLAEARQALSLAGVADAGFEARRLIEHVAGVQPVDLVARPEQAIAADAIGRLNAALARRAAGEPLHRILGWREFYGLRLSLSAETLEPRPDTETLVDAVLPFVRETIRERGACRILDLGTGTGAIALALLHEVSEAVAVGIDVSEDALATAAANAAALGLEGRFHALRSDWFERVEGHFHLIVANPPYISGEEMKDLSDDVVRFDPARALDGGADGLDAYRAIAGAAGGFLEAGGRVALEIGFRQRGAVTALFEDNGFGLVAAHRDFGGNDRVVVFEKPGNAGAGGERTGRPLVIGGE